MTAIEPVPLPTQKHPMVKHAFFWYTICKMTIEAEIVEKGGENHGLSNKRHLLSGD